MVEMNVKEKSLEKKNTIKIFEEDERTRLSSWIFEIITKTNNSNHR